MTDIGQVLKTYNMEYPKLEIISSSASQVSLFTDYPSVLNHICVLNFKESEESKSIVSNLDFTYYSSYVPKVNLELLNILAGKTLEALNLVRGYDSKAENNIIDITYWVQRARWSILPNIRDFSLSENGIISFNCPEKLSYYFTFSFKDYKILSGSKNIRREDNKGYKIERFYTLQS